MRRFDYSFLNKRVIDSDMLDRILNIQKLKIMTDERKKQFPSVFKELESRSTLQSVKWSNVMEGIVVTDKRIIEIVQQNSYPLNNDEMEIAGYRDALVKIHQEYERLELTENTILELQRIMTSYIPEKNIGYRKENNPAPENNPYSNRSIRLKPIPANETEEAVHQLLVAYNCAKEDNGINSFLVIPCFILDLLYIHPMSEDNRRLSRLISVLIMYKEGLDIGRYISFEEQISRSKDEYYASLKRSSEGWHKNNNDYLPFIYNFINTIYQCYKELDKRFNVIGDKKVNKTNRIEAVIMNSDLPISKKEICELLPDVSPTTVESVLSRMMMDDIIKKVGGNRNARYIKIMYRL
jgi:Fic family protein